MRTVVAVALWTAWAAAQSMLTLEQVTARKSPDFAPVYEGEVVAIRGTVSTKPVDMVYYTHLAIQDGTQAGTFGLVLEGPPSQFASLQPGDRVEAYGTISKRAGLPVLLPVEVQRLSHAQPPQPVWVKPEELDSFRYLGVLVTTEARIVEVGESSGGEYAVIGTREKGLKIFLPLSVRGPKPRFSGYRPGDKIRVVGFASQDCPSPPYNRFFQIVVTDPEGVTLVSRRWLIRPELFAAALVGLAFVLALWWARGRRVMSQRRMIKTLYSLGEEIIGAGSIAEILKKLAAVLPPLLNVSGVRLYVHNPAANSLDQVESPTDTKPVSIPIVEPAGLIPSAAVACFRNQALLAIPDTRRSPFPREKSEAGRVRSAMFVPMLAQSDLLGVMEIYDEHRTHDFAVDEQVLAQHLANQTAIALRLMKEQSIRDQLTRTEKLAAAGQLLSGVAAELRAPLEAISKRTELLLLRRRAVSEEDVRAIAAEVEKASSIVSRLVSFSQSEPAEAKPVDLHALLRSLMEFRRQEWNVRGIQVPELAGHEPVFVLGSRGQLERVFLSLLIHAEQSLAEAPEKKLSVALSVLGKRALVEISYSSTPLKLGRTSGVDEQSETGVLIEGVVRGIIQSHGGTTRLVRIPGVGSRMEVEVPLALEQPLVSDGEAQAFAPRLSTVLLVEADPNARQRMLALLGKRGYRIVPAASAEQAAEFVQRFRFDLVFCAMDLPGLNWLEFLDSFRQHLGTVVLMTEAPDPELARSIRGVEIRLLARPVVEPELEKLLAAVEASLSAPAKSAD